MFRNDHFESMKLQAKHDNPYFEFILPFIANVTLLIVLGTHARSITEQLDILLTEQIIRNIIGSSDCEMSVMKLFKIEN